jgi:hypothetical protein
MKTVITLEQLETMVAAKLSEESGRHVKPQQPIELSPAWGSYCKSKWGVWGRQLDYRTQQLIMLDIIDTHVIDYYENTEMILPL